MSDSLLDEFWFNWKPPEYSQDRTIKKPAKPRIWFEEISYKFKRVDKNLSDLTCLMIKEAMPYFPNLDFSVISIVKAYGGGAGYYQFLNSTIGLEDARLAADMFFVVCHELRHAEQHQSGIHKYAEVKNENGVTTDYQTIWNDEVSIPSVREFQQNTSPWSEQLCRATYFKSNHESDANGFAWSCCDNHNMFPSNEWYLENRKYATILF